MLPNPYRTENVQFFYDQEIQDEYEEKHLRFIPVFTIIHFLKTCILLNSNIFMNNTGPSRSISSNPVGPKHEL